MRISMGLVAALALAAGCGGGGGEPIGGDLVIDWGTLHVVPDTGAAIENPDMPGQMVVGIGDLDFNCGWADDRLKDGTAVSFSLDPAQQVPGAYTPLIAVIHVDGSELSLNAATGTLNITAVGERLVGSLSMTTTDDVAGNITTMGNFDVINCF